MYHLVYFDVAPENRDKVVKIFEDAMKSMQGMEGIEPVGLFYPRASGYMFVSITKCRDYTTWEKYYKSIREIREKIIPLITRQTDMFFDEFTTPSRPL